LHGIQEKKGNEAFKGGQVKIKIFTTDSRCEVLADRVNSFIKGKDIVSITATEVGCDSGYSYTVLVVYREGK